MFQIAGSCCSWVLYEGGCFNISRFSTRYIPRGEPKTVKIRWAKGNRSYCRKQPSVLHSGLFAPDLKKQQLIQIICTLPPCYHNLLTSQPHNGKHKIPLSLPAFPQIIYLASHLRLLQWLLLTTFAYYYSLTACPESFSHFIRYPSTATMSSQPPDNGNGGVNNSGNAGASMAYVHVFISPTCFKFYASTWCSKSYHLPNNRAPRPPIADAKHRLQILLSHPRRRFYYTFALSSRRVVDQCLQTRQPRYGLSMLRASLMNGALRKAHFVGCEEIVYEFETEGWAGLFKMAMTVGPIIKSVELWDKPFQIRAETIITVVWCRFLLLFCPDKTRRDRLICEIYDIITR